MDIREYILAAGSDSIAYFGGRFDGGYHIQQNPEEFAALIEYLLAKEVRILNYIEIGSAAGGATRVLCELLPIQHVYIMDLNHHPKHIHRPENLKAFRPTEFIGDSHSPAAREWLERQNVRYDFVFIDGDHSYEGVKADTEMMLSKAAPGAYFLFHDILVCEGVRRWTGELKMGCSQLLHVRDFSNKLGIGLFRNGE